jgi:hypothetical protein
LTADATPIRSRIRVRPLVTWIAIAGVLVGVSSTWTTAGSTTLNGVQGPNDGWLVVIVSGFAIVWSRVMERTSWTGAIAALGLLGAAIVVCWTAIEDWQDNREVFEASAGHGLWLVVAAGAVLAAVAVLRGVELTRALARRDR